MPPSVLSADEASRCRIYIDFDNTITCCDVLDCVIEKFAVSDEWRMFEHAWRDGRIGAKQCLTGQLGCIRATRAELSRYLAHVRIDPHFRAFLDRLRAAGVEPAIVSDGFTWLISSVLHNNGIRGLRICANDISFRRGRLVPSFPHASSRCRHCANCKTVTIAGESFPDTKVVYIGDGLSDVCPARYADIVFAKSELLDLMRSSGRPCLPFGSFKDISACFSPCRPAPGGWEKTA